MRFPCQSTEVLQEEILSAEKQVVLAKSRWMVVVVGGDAMNLMALAMEGMT